MESFIFTCWSVSRKGNRAGQWGRGNKFIHIPDVEGNLLSRKEVFSDVRNKIKHFD